ncbi:probable glycerol-3-phosphate regulon repressor [Fulvimarina pelagi HTCC2506]|uniref:Probable glycerol-3-phosphate regulon repressor n=2 Tax=Fulvimarina pelagi TaxID=217511 RepID=Q0G6K1_9HYPH|nr:probable glycerol-3-phosphate regulon repressor [Fulvimarina pelagi HTCC2506]
MRHPEILEIARVEGKVSVEDLAERFEVTAQTIRRDLSELCDSGQLKRVHGGAILASGVANIGYEARRALNADAKARIGRAAAAAIPNGSSIFMNIGTSTEAVAREMLHHRDLLVMTNNLNIANILAANGNCEVIVAGGTLRRSDGGIVGSMTNRMVEQFKFDLAIIGCSALDDDGDILDFDVQEVGVSQAALQRARNVILVADASKFERNAPACIASLEAVDVFYTDASLSEPLLAKCRGWGTIVAVC